MFSNVDFFYLVKWITRITVNAEDEGFYGYELKYFTVLRKDLNKNKIEATTI